MKPDRIIMDHGGGGRMSHNLVADIMLPAFDNPVLSALNDGAVIDICGQKLAFTTDSYVVDPLFFPGGHIGDLAVNGTVNDLSMCGARPLYLSVGIIMEEGFRIADLEMIIKGMGEAAGRAGVTIVTGDTKVVPRKAADKIFINTAGIGVIPENINISADRARPGDKVILSGTIADHGMTILSRRESLEFHSDMKSDTAPLNKMVAAMLETCPDIRVMRDPTRGGVAAVLNEIAISSGVCIKIRESRIPVRNEVAGTCELLGIDPLYVANEGKLIAVVPKESAEAVLSVIKKNEFGADACIIGDVTADFEGKVVMQTHIGGTRIVDMPSGEQLPRIC